MVLRQSNILQSNQENYSFSKQRLWVTGYRASGAYSVVEARDSVQTCFLSWLLYTNRTESLNKHLHPSQRSEASSTLLSLCFGCRIRRILSDPFLRWPRCQPGPLLLCSRARTLVTYQDIIWDCIILSHNKMLSNTLHMMWLYIGLYVVLQNQTFVALWRAVNSPMEIKVERKSRHLLAVIDTHSFDSPRKIGHSCRNSGKH